MFCLFRFILFSSFELPFISLLVPQERVFLTISNYIFTAIFVAEMTVKVKARFSFLPLVSLPLLSFARPSRPHPLPLLNIFIFSPSPPVLTSYPVSSSVFQWSYFLPCLKLSVLLVLLFSPHVLSALHCSLPCISPPLYPFFLITFISSCFPLPSPSFSHSPCSSSSFLDNSATRRFNQSHASH